MLPKWLTNIFKARQVARQDAATLIRAHRSDAYRVARERAREARNGSTIDADRDSRHWDRVRAHIARELKISRTDTATRMLDDSR